MRILTFKVTYVSHIDIFHDESLLAVNQIVLSCSAINNTLKNTESRNMLWLGSYFLNLSIWIRSLYPISTTLTWAVALYSQRTLFIHQYSLFFFRCSCYIVSNKPTCDKILLTSLHNTSNRRSICMNCALHWPIELLSKIFLSHVLIFQVCLMT